MPDTSVKEKNYNMFITAFGIYDQSGHCKPS